jgi:hypothetical protein
MPLEEDFCKAAKVVQGKSSTLNGAWGSDNIGFYSYLLRQLIVLRILEIAHMQPQDDGRFENGSGREMARL